MDERRKQSRYKISDMAYAACQSEPCIVGQIIDVSQAGISFSYMDEKGVPATLSEIGIRFVGYNIVVKKMPFQSVYDAGIVGHPTSTVKMRRHGGYFLSPTPDQEKKLEQFIQLQSTKQVLR